MNGPAPVDPVRAKRAQMERLATTGKRVGYLLFLVAIVVFVVGYVVDLTGPLVAVITGCIVVGSILLAPAIVVGYAVKAAEREDRERGL